MARPNWEELKKEYKSTTISQRALGAKYGIPRQTIENQAVKNGWSEARAKHQGAVGARAGQRIEDAQVEDLVKTTLSINDLTEQLIEKVAIGISQYDVYIDKARGRGKDSKGNDVTKEISVATKLEGVANDKKLQTLTNALEKLHSIQQSGRESQSNSRVEDIIKALGEVE